MIEYPIIILLSVLGMILLISSNDLIITFLAIELQSLSLYVLASMYGKSRETAISAGLKYFVLGSLSTGIILLGMSIIYGLTGLTEYEGLKLLSMMVGSEGGLNVNGDNLSSLSYLSKTIPFAIILLITGLLFKIAAAPFHNWAPDVYDGVPIKVTAWLTIMPKLSILIAILILVNTIFSSSETWQSILLISSILSILLGTILGLNQIKIKRLLAYSAISHVGIMLFGILLNTPMSTQSLLFYMIQYTLTSINIFYIFCVNNPLLETGFITTNKGLKFEIKYINELRVFLAYSPFLAISFTLSIFSLAGIPPLIGFFGKMSILESILESGYYLGAIVLVIGSVISSAYYLKLIKVIYFEDEPTIKGQNKYLFLRRVKRLGVFEPYASIIALTTLGMMFFILKPSLLLNITHLVSNYT